MCMDENDKLHQAILQIRFVGCKWGSLEDDFHERLRSFGFVDASV